MIVRKSLDLRVVLRVSWRRQMVLLLLSAMLLLLEVPADDPLVGAIGRIESILGAAVSILMGFRVNAAYDRWWEARRAWGSFVNESRTFARQVVSLISSHFRAGEHDPAIEEVRRSLIHAQIGLAHALKNHLRRQDALQAGDLAPHLPVEACKAILASRHVPLAILLWMARRLQAAFEDRHTEDFRHMQIDATFNRMTDAIGAMDRIKTTVFPRQYAVFGTTFTAIFVHLLPMALVPGGGWPAVPFVMGVGFIFFALDGVAGSIENPFEGTYNDTPMTSLARGVELHLLEVLGERDLPAPLEPVDGILM